MNPSLFSSPIKDPKTAYLLGFLWGDGYISKHPDWDSYIVGCEISESDFKELKEIFFYSHCWNILKRERYGKVYYRIYSADKELYKFLYNLGYKNKEGSHEKVLSIIDVEFRRFFILGLFDADGNIFEKNGRESNCTICSAFSQNWTYLRDLLKENGIDFKIIQRVDKKRGSGYSHFMTNTISDVCRFSIYLYEDTPVDLGLSRKRIAFKRVNEYVKERYGSLIYNGRIDYSSFLFDGLEVLAPVSLKDKKWKWVCLLPDGTKIIRGMNWLASKRGKRNESKYIGMFMS